MIAHTETGNIYEMMEHLGIRQCEGALSRLTLAIWNRAAALRSLYVQEGVPGVARSGPAPSKPFAAFL